MNSKEKAKELFEKFTKASEPKIATLCWDEQEEVAQQCALIAVETILEDLDDYHDSHYHDERLSYWSSVIEEIEKL